MTKRSLSIWTRKARKLARLVRVPEYRGGLRRGIAAAVEHEAVPFAYEYRTVIDVGAGRGQFALFAHHRFPDAIIYSFEPLPESYGEIERLFGRTDAIRLQQIAIGREAGTASVHVTADRDSSSLFRPTKEQTARFPGTDAVSSLAVDVRPLDGMVTTVEAPALLKLDVQGGELDALVGAESLLTMVAEALVECSFVQLYEDQPLAQDIVTHLADKGFYLRGIFSAVYGDDGVCLQADLLFTRKGEADRRSVT